ncbi:potassium channel subfamily K member 1-like [Scyliorhinus canicula]|uniref:potassium channel subfamily K member 1-like n=1 Tax=Scyliorhinus canicula TaxID=7830 RepID=UPI0018F2B870|nr:potassium channel subfamily K member 1-like [Scyliorhinus canicula]
MARCGLPSLLPLLLGGFYLCYLLLGAVIVSLIEQPQERRLREEMRLLKSQFLNLSSCLVQSDLERFLAKVLVADRYGVSVLSNASSKTNWDFASSFFFASTLITTVGESREMFDFIYRCIQSFEMLSKKRVFNIR